MMGEQQTELVENKRLVQGDKVYSTPMDVTLEVIGGKWKALLVYRLLNGPLRFSELKRLVPDITEKMLTQQLRALERGGVPTRTASAEVPPRAEYRGAQPRATVQPVLAAMCEWGRSHWQQQGE